MKKITPTNRKSMGLALLVVLNITGTVNSGIVYLKPIVLGSLMDGFRFSSAHAGFVVGIETLGIGIGVAFLALFGMRWDRRRPAMAGAALALLTSVMPLIAHGFAAMLVERLLAGFGCGLVTASVLSVLAADPNPDRILGIYFACTSLVAAILVPIAARVVGIAGPIGAYLMLAGLAVIALIGSFLIPSQVATKATDLGAGRLLSREGAATLLVALIYWTGTGALWAFEERIGISHGFREAAIGGILGGSQLASLAGALIASVVALRFGRLIPVTGSILLSLGALALIALSSRLGYFGGGALGFNFACLVYTTFVAGLMAALDSSGRLVVLGTITQSWGLALGPTLGGLIALYGPFDSVVWLSVGCQVSALAILMPLLVRDRRTYFARAQTS